MNATRPWKQPSARSTVDDRTQAPATHIISQFPIAATRQGNVVPVGRQSPKLRVLFVTEDDPLYVIQFFDVFFSEFPRNEIEICGITIDRAFHEPIWKLLRRMYGFYDLTGLFRQGLRFMNVRLRRRSIESLSVSMGLTVIRPRSINRPKYIARVRAIAPDVIISVAAPEIFKAELLSIPRLGCINIHSGRLPTYRGMMPTFWQMQRGERAATITVHRMAEKLDAGDVLAMQAFPIAPMDSLDRVIKGTKCEGARLVIRVLRDLRAGRTQPKPLDMSGAEYFSFPKRTDVREFRKIGHRLL
jgi:methionyl-tRNA formyltransferase